MNPQRQTTGVLLVNLGTPSAPTAAAIRRYLRQFLSDPRVVDLPRALWLPVLYGFILPFRPGRLTEAYAKVWGPDGSPLMAWSLRQRAALQARLGDGVPLELAMTYGEPSIPSALRKLEQRGAQRIVVLPLYPQYSGTTTSAVFDAVFDDLKRRRAMPDIATVGSYYDHPAYIAALAQSVRAHRSAQSNRGGAADHLLVSFHSIPQACVERGDPYQRQCEATAQLLAQALKLGAGQWSLSYQSRLGNQPWLQPYTDIVLPQMAARGIRKLDVICPGFAADCLETLEEVAIRYAELFTGSGGETLRYIPALNDRPDHIAMMAELVGSA